MADKKITDLTLIDEMISTVNFPGDDTIQTYRVTGAQVAAFVKLYNNSTRTISAAAQNILSTDNIVLLDPTSASFTQMLPALAGVDNGFSIKLKNIATNGNEVTIDANSSELIDNAETFVLGSDPSMDYVTLLKTSTKWLII